MTLEEHAEAILKAAGSSLRHYTIPITRKRILEAVERVYMVGKLDGQDEIYRLTQEVSKR